jgi:hypothetical protein
MRFSNFIKVEAFGFRTIVTTQQMKEKATTVINFKIMTTAFTFRTIRMTHFDFPIGFLMLWIFLT